MQLKPITAIIVLSLVAASLSVAGCTSQSNQVTSELQTANATTTNTTHKNVTALSTANTTVKATAKATATPAQVAVVQATTAPYVQSAPKVTTPTTQPYVAPTTTPTKYKAFVSLAITGGASPDTATDYLKVSKSAGSHTFSVASTPSAACGNYEWNIDGNVVADTSGCGGSSATVNLNQPGLTLGVHFIGASYLGNDNYAYAFTMGGFELVA